MVLRARSVKIAPVTSICLPHFAGVLWGTTSAAPSERREYDNPTHEDTASSCERTYNYETKC